MACRCPQVGLPGGCSKEAAGTLPPLPRRLGGWAAGRRGGGLPRFSVQGPAASRPVAGECRCEDQTGAGEVTGSPGLQRERTQSPVGLWLCPGGPWVLIRPGGRARETVAAPGAAGSQEAEGAPPHAWTAPTLLSRQRAALTPPSEAREQVQHAYPTKKRNALQASVPLPGRGPAMSASRGHQGGTGELSPRHRPAQSRGVRASAGTLPQGPSTGRGTAGPFPRRRPPGPTELNPGPISVRSRWARRCPAPHSAVRWGGAAVWSEAGRELGAEQPGGPCVPSVPLCAPRPPPVSY